MKKCLKLENWKKRGNYYTFEDEVIGNTIDSVIAYFKDVKINQLRLLYKKEVREAKKGK